MPKALETDSSTDSQYETYKPKPQEQLWGDISEANKPEPNKPVTKPIRNPVRKKGNSVLKKTKTFSKRTLVLPKIDNDPLLIIAYIFGAIAVCILIFWLYKKFGSKLKLRKRAGKRGGKRAGKRAGKRGGKRGGKRRFGFG